MALSVLSPFDHIKPSQILNQYSEWIYFTLILVFFISISGLALRKHFEKPYVKPLIISVGLMLTVGIFKFKERLNSIFQGWGVLGTVLLGVIAATIPYGLSRGFGLSTGKSFYLTYILFYILSWIQFPKIFSYLEDNNLGIVSVGLLLLFIFAVFKLFKFGGKLSKFDTKIENGGSTTPALNKEMDQEILEQRLVNGNDQKLLKIQLRSIEDITMAIDEVLQILSNHRNMVPEAMKEKISKLLRKIAKDEIIFTKAIVRIKKDFERIKKLDSEQIRQKKERIARASDKERKILEAELKDEALKQKIEESIIEIENSIKNQLSELNSFMQNAVEKLNSSYPYDAYEYLARVKEVIKVIMDTLKNAKQLEKELARIMKDEKHLLKKEKRAA